MLQHKFHKKNVYWELVQAQKNGVDEWNEGAKTWVLYVPCSACRLVRELAVKREAKYFYRSVSCIHLICIQ